MDIHSIILNFGMLWAGFAAGLLSGVCWIAFGRANDRQII